MLNKIIYKFMWKNVLDLARTTDNKFAINKEPSDKWKYNILLAEHSPIRALTYTIKLYQIKYWISVHLSRHSVGISHFVSTQREDRTDMPRDFKYQDYPVNHTIIANANAIINISRKRLCNKSHPETKKVWEYALAVILTEDKHLFEVCVPECVYRGFCPEFKSCNFDKTKQYEIERNAYINLHKK
jgi:hypothetical protein